ncbi:MAG: DUF6612 family protein [Nocardioides sp.]
MLVPSRRTRLRVLAATPLLLASLTACGGGGVSNDEFLSKMREGLTAMDTAHTTMSMEGQAFEMTAEGDIDYTQDPVSMDMKIKNSGASGDVVTDVRLIDGIMYMSSPDSTGGKFYRLDPKDPNNPLAGQGDISEQMDPAKAVDRFSKGLEKVELEGTEQVNGVEADHYVLTLDPGKISGLPTADGVQLPEKLACHVWLDDKNRTVKVEINLGETLGTTEMTSGDFDAPVKIEVPSADQILSPEAQ